MSAVYTLLSLSAVWAGVWCVSALLSVCAVCAGVCSVVSASCVCRYVLQRSRSCWGQRRWWPWAAPSSTCTCCSYSRSLQIIVTLQSHQVTADHYDATVTPGHCRTLWHHSHTRSLQIIVTPQSLQIIVTTQSLQIIVTPQSQLVTADRWGTNHSRLLYINGAPISAVS